MEVILMLVKAGLTPKQMLYMQDLMGGNTMSEIANKHNVSLPTVSRTIKAARIKISRLEDYQASGGDQEWHGKI